MSKRKPEPVPEKYEAVEAIKARKAPDFQPGVLFATVEEAKELLRKRYESRGFEVVRVSRHDKDWFSISFPEGKGPMGCTSVLCNWPHVDDAKDYRAAHEVLKARAGIRSGLKIKDEGKGLAKELKKIAKLKKEKK